jgi:hypothetical protein
VFWVIVVVNVLFIDKMLVHRVLISKLYAAAGLVRQGLLTNRCVALDTSVRLPFALERTIDVRKATNDIERMGAQRRVMISDLLALYEHPLLVLLTLPTSIEVL